MSSYISARLLMAGIGGIIFARIVRSFVPMGKGLAQAVLEGMALIVASLAVYRSLARRAPKD